MKIVKVTYTTKAEFSEQNQRNIKNVMTDLQHANHQGINYNACLSADNKTFIHTAFFKSDEDQKILNENKNRNKRKTFGFKNSSTDI